MRRRLSASTQNIFRQYDECRNVYTALCNKLLAAFEVMYLSPLKNTFTGYSIPTMQTLMIHIYGNYARIFSMDLAYNDKKLRDSCNPDEPLNSLYTRLNECVDYAAAAGNPITE